MGAPASSSSSSSSFPEASVPSSSYSHLSRASAAKAIQHLDRFAFPTLALAADEDAAAAKRRKVAEVMTDSPLRSKRSSNFSTLAGISHLHRERARRRRSERLAGGIAEKPIADKKSTTKAEAEALAQTFQPFSRPLLLTRLATFSVSTYSHKPESCRNLDAVTLAMQGWMHESGKERDVIACATCRAEWKVEVAAAADIAVSSREQQEAAWKEVDGAVLTKHQQWCPWKLRQCHASLFRVPVHSRVETLSEIVQGATRLSQCKDIDLVQITSDVEGAELESLQQLSATDGLTMGCILLSLLGWKLTETPGPVQGCIVQCDMCARKIGLWNFLKDRPGNRTLHVNKEHKSYCPFVNSQVQSGSRGSSSGVSLSSTPSPRLNAFEQRTQILRGSSENVRHLVLNQQQIRQMKSSETLAKLKSIIM